MGITLDQLVFDTANPDDGANVGAYVRAGDDGTAIGHVGDALKVDIGSVSDLDIRDLDSAQDSVEIKTAAGQALDIDASGYVTANINGTVTVTATDLDIRDLTAASDSVASHLFDGAGTALTSTLVSGKQALDVRLAEGVNVEVDLSHVDDSVRLGDGTTLTNVTTDNRLEVFSSPNSSAQNSAATVGTSASELAASPLTNRKRIIIQNLGNKAIYVGGSAAVTTANGVCIPRRSSLELPWGQDVDVFAISGSAGQDVRILEVA